MLRQAKVVAWFVSIVLAVTPAIAQDSHVVDREAMEDALAEHIGDDEMQREAVLRLLQDSHVRELAGELGLDLKRAEAAVDTLEGEELVELAAMAGTAEAGLSGGESITLSTTTIIIALLVLILIIVAT
ncbi:MAG TPA: hypothetical protein VLK65_29360 [Vicinamibacteria bacterium]|nr:hypothetical protein [Vicinamibacteria bacterium]